MPTVIHLIYVDPIHGRWRVSGEERGQNLGTFADKESAIASARGFAKSLQGQMIVRTENQTVEFAEDYASVEG